MTTLSKTQYLLLYDASTYDVDSWLGYGEHEQKTIDALFRKGLVKTRFDREFYVTSKGWALLDDQDYEPIPEWVCREIKATWTAAREAGGQMEAFRILERMVDRLGYGRRENNPPLIKPEEVNKKL